jgi:hypothetical protein
MQEGADEIEESDDENNPLPEKIMIGDKEYLSIRAAIAEMEADDIVVVGENEYIMVHDEELPEEGQRAGAVFSKKNRNALTKIAGSLTSAAEQITNILGKMEEDEERGEDEEEILAFTAEEMEQFNQLSSALEKRFQIA